MTTTQPTEGDPEHSDPETVANNQRGCGYLEEGKAYLRADIGPDGTLPPFVEFETPVPYLEGHERSWSHFPGIQFETTVTGERGMTETRPTGEVWNHLDRMRDDTPDGDHLGEMTPAHAQDLLMHVGKSYYPEPEDFISEAKEHGVSKAIPVSQRQKPPVIDPGRTRLFLVHPKAIELDRPAPEDWAEGYREGDRETHFPGVIGYTYLTRTVYTGTQSGDDLYFPDFAQKYAREGSMELVEIGQPIPAEGDGAENADLGHFASDDEERVPLADVTYHQLRSVVATRPELELGQTPSKEAVIEALESAGLDSLPASEVRSGD